MSLTMGAGPLAETPPPRNFSLEGPEPRLVFTPFPRRVRGELGGAVVLESDAGMLLHGAEKLPVLYVPQADVRREALDAGAVQDGSGGPDWLEGYVTVDWNALDAWYDEDERVRAHLRDPFQRVDVRASSRHVRVLAGDDVVADSRSPVVLSETGIPNRWYLPPGDVRTELLEPSDTTTHCPYKGDAAYRHVRTRDGVVEDAAWCYAEPFEDALKARGYFSFSGDGLVVEVDGEPAD